MIKLFIEPGYEVKKPVREFGNAGIDFFVPEYNKVFEDAFIVKNTNTGAVLDFVKKCIIIKPHGDVNIPTGVRSRISANIALEAQNKSGVAMKYKMVYGAATVDANYQGIIHAHLINTSDKEVIIPLGAKIVQFIPRFIDISPVEVCDDITLDEFYDNFEFSNRGEGAFGSTGTK